ncbi:thiamine phosphate synthase [Tepidibacillus fermentans]|uniref:Thiamine-phosphate synthase n=1 Tax=Tepidibacillus fermentans TaxID=1281767 RepID=A0A4R3K955_9BACI|nr:thiamine phosphate synthase [Tepidibacillus fermentans]TCS79201.1 thiamine-phosphate diphosphorylase [Tepidibacillus fermentans]
MIEIAPLSVYLVIGRDDCVLSPIEVVKQALEAGVKTVQLREKKGNMKEIIEFGREIRQLTKEYNAQFFVNDRLDLAQILEADGIHIGQDDLPIEEIKKITSPTFKIGISARTVEEAIEAEKAGADYLGVGAIYSTATKQDAKTIGLEGLDSIRQNVYIPIIAIGGIQKEHIPDLVRSGADGIAVVSAITRSANPFLSAKELIEEWRRTKEGYRFK